MLLALGAALALGGSLITGLLAQNAERESFLREQRLTEYSALISAMTELDANIRLVIAANVADDGNNPPKPDRSPNAVDPVAVEKLNTAFSRIQLVGSPDTVLVAANGMSYYSRYLAFIEDRLADIAEGAGDESSSPTDWFYDGGADFMAYSAECLQPLAKDQFVRAAQTELGLEPIPEPNSPACSKIAWDNLYADFVDALVAGSFPPSGN